jgi:hypothetical protein
MPGIMCSSVGGGQLIQSGITGLAGLLGVVVGGWITSRTQRQERQSARKHEQLMGFYAPLRAMRAEIKAKSELRTHLHSAGEEAWAEKIRGVDDPLRKKKIVEQERPKVGKIWDRSDEQLKKELVPLYGAMLKHFSSQMGLAEGSTLEYYPALGEFVEIWNRFLDGSLPTEVANKMDHREDKLKPFYEDVEKNFSRLSAELKK